MASSDPLHDDVNANEWYREKVRNQEWDEIPEAVATFEYEVPEDVEAFVRARYHDIEERGGDANLTDLLLDHIDLDPEFILQGEIPDDEPWLMQADDVQEQ